MSIAISEGLREEVIPDTPKDYDNEPNNRPDLSKVVEVVDKLKAITTKTNL
ncbi:16234_t:CDS:2, partial [Funneliformis geosporum]